MIGKIIEPMIVMKLGLDLMELLVSVDVLNKSPPVRLPAVAKKLNIRLVLGVRLIHGVGGLEVAFQRKPSSVSILGLGSILGVGPPAGALKINLR